MGLNQAELRVRQPPRLVEDLVRDTYLADIMDEDGYAESLTQLL